MAVSSHTCIICTIISGNNLSQSSDSHIFIQDDISSDNNNILCL
ncbi:MAG: hypothetical protein Q8S84_07885 [bacterium]|nr:hypothetical protein [bacterium]